MAPRLTAHSTSTSYRLIDVLDGVLDKGIVIDATIRVSAVGIDLVGVDARLVVGSFETYMATADTLPSTSHVCCVTPRRAGLSR